MQVASRAEAQRRREDIRPDVQAQHPAFAREPPQQPRNPAANHPGYTPDPPRRDDDGTGDCGGSYRVEETGPRSYTVEMLDGSGRVVVKGTVTIHVSR